MEKIKKYYGLFHKTYDWDDYSNRYTENEEFICASKSIDKLEKRYKFEVSLYRDKINLIEESEYDHYYDEGREHFQIQKIETI